VSDDTGIVTLGEVYRLLLAHGGKLDNIETQTRITNGRVTRLEGRADVVDREVRDLKRGRPEVAKAVPTSGAISLSIPMDVKTLVIVLSAAAALIAAVVKGLA